MVADELAGRRWFRQRLDEIGAQYPELKTPEAQERLAWELARQEREGEVMAEVDRPVKGRPVKGSITPTVLKTMSFKASEAFIERLQKYAREHRQPVSELIRDGLEMRLGDDLLAYRHGGGSEAYTGEGGSGEESTALREVITALAGDVRQMREAIQALEQRVIEAVQTREQKQITGNTIIGDTENAFGEALAPMVPGVKVGKVSGAPTVAVAPKVKSDKSAVEARIRHMREQGFDSPQIANQFNAEGLPTLRGEGKWHPRTIRRLWG